MKCWNAQLMYPRCSPSIRLYTSLSCLLLSLAFLLLLIDSPSLTLSTVLPWTQKVLDGTPVFPRDQLIALQQDPPPDELPLASIIIAAQRTTDLSWTSSLKANYSLFAYDVDNPNNADERLRIPANKGHEAMVYLSWIIDNYDSLPWAGIFVHGHDQSWHQLENMVDLIHGLNVESLARAGYISLRCHWTPSCPVDVRTNSRDPVVWEVFVNERATERAIAGSWKLMFPHEKMPKMIASPCCAQFAVTRRAIRQRPKADYERLRSWLMETLLPDGFSGRVLEKLWAYLLTGDAIHCPPARQCACEYFTNQCETYRPEKAAQVNVVLKQ